jgi:hypothetical protein
MAVADVVNDLISNAATRADNLSTQATTAAQNAIDSADLGIGGYTPPTIIADLVAPATAVPTDVSDSIATAFDTAFDMYHDDFQTRIAEFLQNYFPSLNAGLTTATDTWIIDSINSGGSGLSVDVEAALWQRDRDRITDESMRLEEEAYAEFAGRGFDMPGGVLLNRLDQVRLDASKKIADSSRTAAITTAEWALKNTQFAVEQGIKLRVEMLDALSKYLAVFAQIPNTAAEYAKVMLAAQTSLWDASARLYEDRIKEEALNVQAQTSVAANATQYGGVFIGTQAEMAKARASAAVGAAGALGQIAAAAIGAQQTGAHLGSQETITA